MTELVLKKLEQQLQCSICLDIYKDPKVLECLHIYCKECLTRLVVKESLELFTLSCPTCRQKTKISDEGVASLKPAFYIYHLLEIREDLKQQGSSSETISIGKENKVAVFCSDHAKKEVELYCETCDQLICLMCAIKKGKHQQHSYIPLSEAQEKCRADIFAWLVPVKKQAEIIREALSKLEECLSGVLSQKDQLLTEINSSASTAHSLIESEKMDLIEKLERMSENKMKVLASQKNALENSFIQLNSCFEFVKAGLDTDSPLKVLKMKPSVSSLVDELKSSFGNETCEPATKVDMEFLPNKHIHEILGQVHAIGSCDETLSRATGSGLTMAEVGKDAVFVIHAMNYLGMKYEEPLRDLTCELVSNVKGTKVRGTVKMPCTNGDSEVIYCPIVAGQHKLHISINGQPITGSPFSVLVKGQVQNLSSSIITIKDIARPWGIAVSERDDEIVASTTALNCISVFSRSSGTLLRKFGEYRLMRFRSPRGIALDKDSNLFLCDCGNHRILKFTLDGKYLSSAGSLGRGLLEFYYPKDVAYNPINDKIYVVDSNDRVQILSSDLSPVGFFGSHGSEIGKFDNPNGITCDKSGNVYVADTYNHRIQVFNAKKEFIVVFGRRGNEDGYIFDPISIAVDSSKEIIYVSEGGRISIFTTKGQFVANSKKAESCAGLAVDNEGLLYTCSKLRNQILVY